MESINPEIMNGQQADVPEIVGSRDISTKVVANAIKYELQSSMMLAKQYPRNLEQSRSLILKTCKRPGFAKKVRYFKPIGAKKITGISIRSAEMLANLWGNIKSISYVMYDEDGDDVRKIPGRRILYVMSIDLESNTSYSSQITIEKTVERSAPRKDQIVYGKRTNSKGNTTYIVKPTEDEFVVKEKKSLAIEKRNTILSLIPYDIKEEMLEKSDETNQSDIKEDPDKALRTILDYFTSINILPKEIEKYLGHSVNVITPAEIGDLRIVAQSIQSGASTWYDFIVLAENERRKTQPETPKDTKTPISEKIAAEAAKREPDKAETSDYMDIQEVTDTIRAAADITTLNDMQVLIAKVDPAFREEASRAFERASYYLNDGKSSSPPGEEQPNQKDDALREKLQTISVGIDKKQKAGIAGELFGDGRKTSFLVRNLDSDQLLKLKEILTSQRLFVEDE